MNPDQVGQLNPTERFLYWVKERHEIYKRRQAGRDKPWTDDEILQRYFFTNPYRENDKVSVWFRENVRDPLKDDPRVLFATVAFRWFNLPTTGLILMGHLRSDEVTSWDRSWGKSNLLLKWDEEEAVARLNHLWDNGNNPVFTGAFMVKAGNGPRGSKIPSVCGCITKIWEARKDLVKVCREDCRLQALWAALRKFRGLGGFMSYEIVCDLRYTSLLENASDVDSWCNIGPGAKRGMNRLMGTPLEATISSDTWGVQTRILLEVLRSRLKDMPRFEMREVEHSLCEFDKYERLRLGEGRSKRRYNGT